MTIDQLRANVATACRLIAMEGFTDLTLGHVSARLPGARTIWIKRKGLALDEVEPEDDVERLHRFLYLTHFSYGKMRGKSFSPTVVGVEATTIKRIEKFAPRLKKVKVYGGDYEKVVRKYDSKDTVFFLDPPYPGYNVDVGESEFDEERFFKLLKSLKGRFLITYGIRGKFPELVKDSDFWTKRIRTRRSIAHMRGVKLVGVTITRSSDGVERS